VSTIGEPQVRHIGAIMRSLAATRRCAMIPHLAASCCIARVIAGYSARGTPRDGRRGSPRVSSREAKRRAALGVSQGSLMISVNRSRISVR